MNTPVGITQIEQSAIGQLNSAVDPRTAFASPDGAGFIAVQQSEAGLQMLAFREGNSGEPGLTFKAIYPLSVSFAPDGRKFVFVAETGEGQVAVVDGVPGPRFDAISSEFDWSADGRLWAYIALRGKEQLLVVQIEGADAIIQPLKGSGLPGTLRVSPDGLRVAYVAGSAPKKQLIINGEVYVEGPEIFGTAAFSPNSKHVAFGIAGSRGIMIRRDAQEYGPYGALGEGTPLWSPDSQKLAWVVPRGLKSSYIINGEETKTPYRYIQKHAFAFSPNSQRVAFAARPGLIGLKGCVVVDDVASPTYLAVGLKPPVFSDDSQHVAYMASTGLKTNFCVLDGKPGQHCHFHIDGSLALSPNGRAAYVAKVGANPVIAVDGLESQSLSIAPDGLSMVKSFRDAPVVWESERTIRHVYLRPEDGAVVVGRASLPD